ncbi:hypothetical protein C8R45DRAFT_827073 [Mycena sanguinolenta]|nr:hypothetical protein C8R45DRAFT_827073 [Mycena sanguinolenta]
MVNSLTSKLQIGSPMASMYLLGNPDHYTNLVFQMCWWKSYVGVVNHAWPDATSVKLVQVILDGIEEEDPEDETQQALLMKSTKEFVGATAVDDYVFWPKEYEHCNVYEWVQVHTC